MEVKRIKVNIIDVELDLNNEYVELSVLDATNHRIKIELDEINVSQCILDEAWSDMGLDNDPAVEGWSPDEMHHERMQGLFEYLCGKDMAELELRGIGVKLYDCHIDKRLRHMYNHDNI